MNIKLNLLNYWRIINLCTLKILGNSRRDHFVGIWVNRNAKRKRPNDVLESWSLFLKTLKEEKVIQKQH